MASPLLGTAMVLLSEGCTYGAKGALRLTTREACEASTVEEGEIDFRRPIGFRIVISFLTFEDNLPVHPDRDYETK